MKTTVIHPNPDSATGGCRRRCGVESNPRDYSFSVTITPNGQVSVEDDSRQDLIYERVLTDQQLNEYLGYRYASELAQAIAAAREENVCPEPNEAVEQPYAAALVVVDAGGFISPLTPLHTCITELPGRPTAVQRAVVDFVRWFHNVGKTVVGGCDSGSESSALNVCKFRWDE